ncbi:MAG: DegT/DnrJ/EryC1/StrS family aminotransferase [Bdellovibrionota bacterium]
MTTLPLIRLSKSNISETEIAAVSSTLREEYLGMGKKVGEFEKQLSEYFGRTAICVNTGTSALQLACQGAGLGTGDEVLIQSLTFVASFQAIHATGAKPVACEFDPNTGCIDLADAEKRVTPRTKAIMPVHYAGNAAGLKAILDFAKKHKLRVIEDAAHAFGTKVDGKLVGSFGDITCFSFDGIKNITSGEGGCVVTDDPAVIAIVKDARLLGIIGDSDNRYKRERTWSFDVQYPGWRYHMSDVMAAIGVEQFKRKDEFRKKRQHLVQGYRARLNNYGKVKLFQDNGCDINPHIFPIRILPPGNRDQVQLKMKEDQIQTGIHYVPNHLLTFFKSDYSLPVTESTFKEMITLPLHFDLSDSDLDRIVASLKKALDGK